MWELCPHACLVSPLTPEVMVMENLPVKPLEKCVNEQEKVETITFVITKLIGIREDLRKLEDLLFYAWHKEDIEKIVSRLQRLIDELGLQRNELIGLR